jgi:hypothetical protein
MCDPTLIISAVSNGLKMYATIQENKNKRAQQQRQNVIAKWNRVNKETAENFRIRQKRKETVHKGFEISKDSRQKRATAVASAESVTGISVNKLMFDFLRQEGEHKNMLLNNLDAEVFASQQRKEAFVTQQEAQMTYVTDVNYLMPIATAGLNYASDYYNWKEKQEMKELYSGYFDQASG